MKKLILLMIGIFVLCFQNQAQSIIDIDGNTYNTITIGSQKWLKENLRTTRLNDGSPIPNITIDSLWSKLTSPGFCNYNNTLNNDTINTFGRLYNLITVSTNMLCPIGWHVPSDDEWGTMENFLIANGYNYDGTKFGDRFTNNKIGKSLAAKTDWVPYLFYGSVGSPELPSKRDSSGFSALPGGYRDRGGNFGEIGNYGHWWCSYDNLSINTWLHYMGFAYTDISRSYSNDGWGCSVRCVGDISTSAIVTNSNEITIYPNPAKNSLFIKKTNSSNSFVTISNLQGELVLSVQNASNVINISNLNEGVYIVKIIDSWNMKIAKFIKE